MGFKVTVRKNGAKHGEMHYSSEAVAVGAANKMKNAGTGVRTNVEHCACPVCGAKLNRRRRNGASEQDYWQRILEASEAEAKEQSRERARRSHRARLVSPEEMGRAVARDMDAPRRRNGTTMAFTQAASREATMRAVEVGDIPGPFVVNDVGTPSVDDVRGRTVALFPKGATKAAALLAARLNALMPRRRNGTKTMTPTEIRMELRKRVGSGVTLDLDRDVLRVGPLRGVDRDLVVAEAMKLDAAGEVRFDGDTIRRGRNLLSNRRRNGTTSANMAAARSQHHLFR